jgi:diadenosine tetraphosphate (Ap4A) HIT family hydrolase
MSVPSASDRDPTCPFCTLPRAQVGLANEHALAFRDTAPLTEGHTLVIPRRHLVSVFDGTPAELAALWQLVVEVRAQLLEEDVPDGFTVGINDGVAAGQTVGHGHVHVIPRRRGDVPDPKGGIRWIIPERAPYWHP